MTNPSELEPFPSTIAPAVPSGMTWTPQQAKALDLCAEWLKKPDEPVFRLFGYAGTGKTTLARHLAATQDGLTLFAAYTGKAASVMRANGCEGASTLHSLLYTPATASQQKVIELEDRLRTASADEVEELQYELRRAKEEAKRPVFLLNEDSPLTGAALLVVDEVSMVNAEMKRDILSFGTKVLVLGDPAQLPPVTGEGAFTNERPHILLTDIQRQARDNPIIRWATAAREGRVIPFGSEGDGCQKLRKATVAATDLVHRGGQLLTGKNDSRRSLNLQSRRILGVSGPYPRTGETLVCLKNNHEIGLLNGVVCTASADAEVFEDGLALSVNYEGREMKDLSVSRVPFDMYNEPDAEADEAPYERMRMDRFDFGYCLTVHKAQGSQWDKVTLCDDGFGKRSAEDRRRWLYTGITRAQRELVIVA